MPQKVGELREKLLIDIPKSDVVAAEQLQLTNRIQHGTSIVRTSPLDGFFANVFQIIEQVRFGLVRVLETVCVVLHLDDPFALNGFGKGKRRFVLRLVLPRPFGDKV